MFTLAATPPALLARPSTPQEPPEAMDLIQYQSPIANQGGRDTCIYQPQIAAMEAAYRRAGTSVALSVEHLVWLRNVSPVADKVADPDLNEDGLANLGGGGMLNGFDILTKYGICRAQDMPYRGDYDDTRASYFHGFDVADCRWWEPFRQISLNRFNLDPQQLSPAAREHARYGIKKFVTVPERDRGNPRKIEEILAGGHEVGVNIWVGFRPGTADKGRGNLPGVVWYRSKDAVPEGNSHALLLVGYDSRRQFFIAKNSWGPNLAPYARLPEGWKDVARFRGYTLLHYNYLIGCREAGYVTEVIDPAADHFHHQRAMGLWDVHVRQKSQQRAVGTAVLAWRHLPGTAAGQPRELRIGDLYWNGGQYRVNARLSGAEPATVSLFIDFDHPQTPIDSIRGSQFSGTMSLPDAKPGTIAFDKIIAPPGVTELFGIPVAELDLSAVQSTTRNPLKPIPTPNLLVNGSFEEGPEVGDFLPLDPGSTAIKGWIVTRGQIDYLKNHWRADDGQHSIDLHGSPGYGGIAQTFSTTRGQHYRVTLSLACSPGGMPAEKHVAVAAAGKHQEFSCDATGRTPQAMGWSTKTWEFEATGETTALEIYTLEKADPNAGPALDNVRVMPVAPK